MKFKSKEELIDEGTNWTPPDKTYHQRFRKGIELAFKSFAERVEFYNRYVHSMDSLNKDESDIFTKWLDYAQKEYGWSKLDWKHCTKDWYWDKYQDWLFDYCFGDVIE